MTATDALAAPFPGLRHGAPTFDRPDRTMGLAALIAEDADLLTELTDDLWHWLSATYQTRVKTPRYQSPYRPKPTYEVSAGKSIRALMRDWCEERGVAKRAGDRLLEELVLVGKVVRVPAGQGETSRPRRVKRKRAGRRGLVVQSAPMRRRPKKQKWAFRLAERAPGY